MRILKLIGKALLAVLVLIVLGVNVLYWTDPVFYRRVAVLPFIDQVRDVEYFTPRELVKGEPGPPLARAPEEAKTITAEGWAKALDYAQSMGSFTLVVWHRGAVQYEYYMPGFQPDERTDPASMHKSIVGILFGQLLADGLIKSVDEPVANYLSDWAGDGRKAITFRHLLTMTSGLERQPFSLSPSSDFWKLNAGTDIKTLTLSKGADDPPGTIFSYYNVNPQIIAIVIERVTGKRYAQYLSERLWSKLGARDAYVYLDRENGLARTYCCLQASAEDWIRVGLLHLNKGRVGEAQVVAEDWMAQVVAPSALNPNYGFQTWLGTTYEAKRSYGKGVPTAVPHSEPFAVPGVIYFDGAGGQRVYVVPSEEMVIVRTGKGGVDFKNNLFLWDDAVIPNALIRGIVPDAEAN